MSRSGNLLLAGDVGGTKTDLALYDPTLRLVREETFASAESAGLNAIVAEFLRVEERVAIAAAAFGVPGPVIAQTVATTNLPWKKVDGASLAADLGCPNVLLLNDLETTAHGALALPASDFSVLNAGVARVGNRAVIAAGTGLGQAFLHWDGRAHIPVGTEGGHASFAPHDAREDGLLAFLRAKHGHVSCERVVSGPGLHLIFQYLASLGRDVPGELREELEAASDPPAVIGRTGVEKRFPICVEALEMFASAYGAQAGNLVLTAMALGGLYVGGGIVTKVLPALTEKGAFMRSFTAKGRYRGLLSEVPVHVILNAKASRLGAAVAARRLLDG